MAFQCNENTAALMASYIVQVATSWLWQYQYNTNTIILIVIVTILTIATVLTIVVVIRLSVVTLLRRTTLTTLTFPLSSLSQDRYVKKKMWWLLIVMWGSIINLILALRRKTNDKWTITSQDAELERRICDNHKKHTGQSPAEVNHLFKSSFFIIILQRKIIFLNQFLAWSSLTTTYTPHHQPPHTHLIFIFSQPVKK